MGGSQFGEVYGLCDPENGHVRYVGSTTWGAENRATQHRAAAGRGEPGGLYDWLRKVGPQNVAVKILKVVRMRENLTTLQDDTFATEKQYIGEILKCGGDLLNANLVPGGNVRGDMVVGDSHTEVFDLARSKPGVTFVLAEGLNGEDSRYLASAVRNKRGSMFRDGEKWQANVSDNGRRNGSRDVHVRFSGTLAKRKKPVKPTPRPSWEAGAREWLHHIGLSDDDIQLGT